MASIRDDLRIVERQTANATRIAIKLMELLQMLINMKSFTDKDTLEVLQILKEYVDKGGELIGDQIKTENKELFMDILKEKGIPVLAIDSEDPEGNKVTFITYRDCDKLAMREVRDQFKYELKIGISEMSPMDFAQKNSGNVGVVIEGLSRAQMELFKREIADKDIPYCIVQNGNTYDISVLLEDKEKVLNVLKDVEYDLSGEEGKDYEDKICKAFLSWYKFEAGIVPEGDETLYIVDSKYPEMFIAVDKDGFSTHTVSASEKKGSDNQKQLVYADKNPKRFKGYDREKILKAAECLYEPVILTSAEMTIINGISEAGEAMLKDWIYYKIAREEIMKTIVKKDKLERFPIRKYKKNPEKIMALSNIPADARRAIKSKIESKGLTESVMVGGCLAYSKKDAADMDEILNETLYSNMNALKALESKVFYEDTEVISLENPSLYVQYLVDTNNSDYVIKLDESGISVYKNGENSFNMSREDPGYEDALIQLINTMKRPVILNGSEMEADHDQRIDTIKRKIRNRNEDFDNNPAVKYLKDIEKYEKNAIHEDIKDDGPDLNQRQREAIERTQKMTVKEFNIDNDLKDKFTDKVIEQRAQREIINMDER